MGETNYILPAAINLAHCMAETGRWAEGIDLLCGFEPIAIRSPYNHAHYYNSQWFRLLESCYKRIGDGSSLFNLRRRYGEWSRDTSSPYYGTDFCLITIQCWSD